MVIKLNEIRSTEWGLDINQLGQVVQGLDDIKQCIYIILNTVKGSDPLRPNFGCGIFEHLDKPTTQSIPDIKKTVAQAILEFEPRVENVKVTLTLNVENLIVSTSYQIKNTVQTSQLDVTYGLTNS